LPCQWRFSDFDFSDEIVSYFTYGAFFWNASVLFLTLLHGNSVPHKYNFEIRNILKIFMIESLHFFLPKMILKLLDNIIIIK